MGLNVYLEKFLHKLGLIWSPWFPLTCKPKSELVTKNHGLISHKPKLNLQKERDVEFHFSNRIQVKLRSSLFNTQSHSTINSCKLNLSHKQFWIRSTWELNQITESIIKKSITHLKVSDSDWFRKNLLRGKPVRERVLLLFLLQKSLTSHQQN